MQKIYKTIIVGLFGLTCSATGFAQLTGTKNIPGDYATLAAAVADLNAQGVGAGGVIFNMIAGNPETAPATGYVIGGAGSLVLTTSSAANPVSFQGNGNTITASPSLTVGAINDAVFKLIGADFITINGFAITENIANTVNTPAASNNMVEFGIAQFYVTATDGAQNNTYSGNSITLNKNYLNTFGIFSDARTTATALTSGADASAATGSNSNTKIYSNNISNVNYGIVFLGSSIAAAMDNGTDIGGVSIATANTFTNWGKGSALSSYNTLTGNNFCIFFNHEVNDNISFNTITGPLNNAITSGAIFKNYSAGQPTGTISTTINNNILSVTNNASAVGAGLVVIACQGITPLLSTASISISNNTVQNCAITGGIATTASITGISNSSLVGLLNMTNNSVMNNTVGSTTATSGGIVGMANSGACTTANITGNIVSGNNVTTGTTAAFTGISCSGASGTVNITANSLINNGISSATGTTGTIVGISNSGACATLNENNNILRGFFTSSPGTATNNGQMQGMVNSGNVTTAINMNNNQFGNSSGGFYTSNAASIGNFFGIVNAAGTAATALSIQNNDMRGIIYNTAATCSQNYINNQAASTLSQNISNNTFTNLSVNTSGAVVFIADAPTLPSGGSRTINNNSIVGTFAKTAAGNYILAYLDNSGSSAGAGSVITAQNNNFSNMSVTGATEIDGWIDLGSNGVAVKTITGNTFSNFSGGTVGMFPMVIGYGAANSVLSGNTISNVSAGGRVDGIELEGGATSALNVSQNNINNLSSTSDTTIGIHVISGAAYNVFKNKIYNLTASSAGPAGFVSAYHADVISGTVASAAKVYNNLIGNLYAPNISSANAIRAIYLGSTVANTSTILSYNTIYLNASSTGANFGSAAVYQTASAAATTNALTMTDNAFVNNSGSAGSGFTEAFQRSSNDLTNFVATSNNNDYYAGTPSATNLIYADGTNAFSTLAGYQAFAAPRDANSVTENPPFISTNGTDPGFLHLTSNAVSLLTNGGLPVAGITDDYDGDARDASTPDIGADEFSFIAVAINTEFFHGYKQANANYLTWKVNVTGNDVAVSLERSADGRDFQPINNTIATPTSALSPFSYTDINPLADKDYYRLKMTELSGKVSYSNILVLLNRIKGTEIVGIAPTVNNGTFKLNASSIKAGTMIIMITDMSGQIVSKQLITMIGGFNSISMDVTHLAAGTYRIFGINEDGKTNAQAFIKK